jgi:hypothetical protein
MAQPAIRPAVKAFAVGGFWCLFLIGFFTQWPLPLFKLAISSLLWLVLILLSVAGFGQPFVQRGLSRDVRPLEFLTFSIVIGYGIVGFLMMIAGAFGLWIPAVARVIVLAGLILQVLNAKPLLALRWDEEIPFMPAALVAIGAGASLLIAFAPVTYYDSLVYHLAMPAQYVQAHRWLPLTSLIYSAFPQQMEMLWTFGMLLANDTLANLIGWSFGVLTVLGVVGFARRFLGQRIAWYSAALLAAMPAFLLLSSGGYIDVGLTCFSFFSLYAIALWAENDNPWTLGLAGLLAGWAVGCKYTGGIPLVLGLVLILFPLLRSPAARQRLGVLYYAGAALLASAGWFLKNLYYVGNPVFPFFHQWGLAKKNPWLGGAAAGYFSGLTEYQSHKPWELLGLLWRMAAHGLDFGRGMDVLGDLGWAPLLALLPGLWLLQKKKGLRGLLLYAGLFFVVWGMTRPVLRFLLPLAPVLALLAGYVWSEFRFSVSEGFSRMLQFTIGCLMLSNLFLFFQTSNVLELFTVPLGLESRDSFLGRRLNYFAAAQFVNELSDAKRVLIVGDQRGYYYRKPILITPVFNKNPLVDWAEEAPDAAALRARLIADGISHILINRAEMKRLEPYRIFPFSDAARQRWDDVRAHLQRVYQDSSCEVLSL